MILVALALVAPAVGADACVPSTSEPDHVVAGMLYVDSDDCYHCHFGMRSLWVYEESNGIDGLQRSDENVDDTCGGQIEPDAILL